MSKPLREKVHVLVDILNQKKIDIRKIKQFLAEGIPDEAFLLREYAWKLTLGYLPRSKDRWKEQIRKQGFIYSEFLKQYLS